MRRLALLLAVLAASACSGKKAPAPVGLVVLTVDGHDVAESDTLLSFGEACVQSASVPASTKSFIIKNPGQSALVLQSVAISGLNASSFTLASTIPGSIAAGGQLQVDVQFAPKSGGAQSASVDVTTNDAVRPTVHVRLTGTGASKLPRPSYATVCTDAHGATTGPDSCQYLAFPDTAVGAVGSQTVHVTNDGCPPLELRGVTVLTDASNRLPDGGPTFAFHGTAPTAANPIKLAAGQSVDLPFDFIPAGNTLFAGDVYVQTNGVHDPQFTHGGFFPDAGPVTDDVFYVSLSGQGLAGQVALTPVSCDFNQTDGGGPCGAHTVNDAGEVAGTFTVQNAGNVGVQLNSVTTDADGGVFTVASPAIPGALAPGSTAAITVTYHPVNGNALAHLLVGTDTGTLTATLVGGTPPVIVVDPGFLSFNDGGIPDGGVADPGTLAPSRTFTVSNTGRGALDVSGISFVGTSLDGGCDGFSIPPGAGSFVLPSQASRAVSVFFTRDAHSGGVATCEAHVASNDLANPDAIVSLYASSYVNCDPIANFAPTGAVNFPKSADGGVFVIDGSSSFDTDDTTNPRCTNGQGDGLAAWEWKLVRTPSANPASTTHLEPPPGVGPCGTAATTCATCLGTTSAGRCGDLKITTTDLFGTQPGYDAPLVNLVLDPADAPGVNGWNLSLTVTDGSGRQSGSSATLQIFAQ